MQWCLFATDFLNHLPNFEVQCIMKLTDDVLFYELKVFIKKFCLCVMCNKGCTIYMHETSFVNIKNNTHESIHLQSPFKLRNLSEYINYNLSLSRKF